MERAMKTRLLMLLALLLVGCGNKPRVVEANNSTPVATNAPVTTLFFDDILDSDAGDEFESAFLLEAGCNGLTLLRYTTASKSAPVQLLAMFHSKYWQLRYFNKPRNPDLAPWWKGPSVSVSPALSSESKFDGPDFYSNVKNAEEAARKACFVAKRRGGQ
jgi:hypothetical protein